jgi:hypothetical protein
MMELGVGDRLPRLALWNCEGVLVDLADVAAGPWWVVLLRHLA